MRNVALGCMRHAACIAQVVAILTTTTEQPPYNETDDDPCEVSVPDHGEMGDCPRTLPSGATCSLNCTAGYVASSRAECTNGYLNTVTCLPRACDLSSAPQPEHGRHGPQCSSLEVLPSGQACEPICDANWSASTPSSCILGRLSPGRCVKCAAGRTFNSTLRECQECPTGTYKVSAVNSGKLVADCITPWNDCACNASTYRTDTAGGEGLPFTCSSCPENARIARPGGWVREGRGIEDCRCLAPHDREVMNETGKQLLRCRAPRSCALSQWLNQSKLVGSREWSLRLGQCAMYTNETGLPSGKACFLECPDRSAPQVKADLLSAPNRQILCEDGEIVQHPPIGTWCSEASWSVPPLVFLVAVTLTAGVAMIGIERRQHAFEQSCSRALAHGIPQGQDGVWNGAKCKVA